MLGIGVRRFQFQGQQESIRPVLQICRQTARSLNFFSYYRVYQNRNRTSVVCIILFYLRRSSSSSARVWFLPRLIVHYFCRRGNPENSAVRAPAQRLHFRMQLHRHHRFTYVGTRHVAFTINTISRCRYCRNIIICHYYYYYTAAAAVDAATATPHPSPDRNNNNNNNIPSPTSPCHM